MKLLFVIIVLLLANTSYADEASKQRYVDRIDREIQHKQKMKELELEYKIYCKEIELQKDDIIVDNHEVNKNYNIIKIIDE